MKLQRNMQSLGQVLAVAAALAVFTGCGGLADDFCDAKCDCEKCNERDAEECVLTHQEVLDIAEAYECSGPAEDYYQCTIDSSTCEDNSWDLVDESLEVCTELQAQIYQCMADHSAILGDGQAPPPGGG